MAYIGLHRDGPTAILRFERPPANAFDLEFTTQFRAALEALHAEPPRGGLVITGEGRSFSGGVDFRAVPGYDAGRKRHMIENINAAITLLYALPVPVVAAVNGHAIGGGLVVALACDQRLFAAGDAKYGLTEVAAGIPFPAGPMEVVRAELSPAAARLLVLTGRTIDAAQALSLGLADERVAAAALMATATETAQALASLPAFASVKEQLKRDVANRLRAIVAAASDPMLAHWV